MINEAFMDTEYTLSVVFCTTNETYSLIESFSNIKKYDCAEEYLFVVSQKASDDCLEIVKELCKKNKNCSYMFQSGFGLGNAIQDAIASATTSHMIFWPADNDMDSNSFPQMVQLSRRNRDKIITVSRWLADDGFQGYGNFRKLLNYLSQKAFGLLFKSNLTDFTNPTQIAPVKLYKKINWEGSDFELIPELIFKPLKIGCEFIEVPCKSIPRKDGKTNGNFFKFAKYYSIIYKIYKMTKKDILIGE